MELLVETKNGLQIGTAVSGVISGDGALDVARRTALVFRSRR